MERGRASQGPVPVDVDRAGSDADGSDAAARPHLIQGEPDHPGGAAGLHEHAKPSPTPCERGKRIDGQTVARADGRTGRRRGGAEEVHELPPAVIRIGDHDPAGTDAAGHRDRQEPGRPGAGDQH